MKKRIDFMKNSKAGMSLLEVVIAMSLFAILVSMILPSIVSMNRYNAVSKESSVATYETQSIAEEITSIASQDGAKVDDLRTYLLASGYIRPAASFEEVYKRVGIDSLTHNIIIGDNHIQNLSNLYPVTVETISNAKFHGDGGKLVGKVDMVVKFNGE